MMMLLDLPLIFLFLILFLIIFGEEEKSSNGVIVKEYPKDFDYEKKADPPPPTVPEEKEILQEA